jgi:hypothetical protein
LLRGYAIDSKADAAGHGDAREARVITITLIVTMMLLMMIITIVNIR